MRKMIFLIITTVLILTFYDYYNAYNGYITKDEAILLIDTRLTTLVMILIVLFLYRKNISYQENKNCTN